MNDMREDTPGVNAPGEESIVLGVASVDTQGGPLVGEEMGGFTTSGISQD